MRTTVVDGIEFACPRYVVRVTAGWQVRLPGEPTVFLADSRFGGPGGSHQAAVDMRVARIPMSEEIDGKFAHSERRGKKLPVGIPGVFLVHQPKRGKRAPSMYLHIATKGQPTRTLYVGTLVTWEARLAEKLEVAKAIRAQQISRARETAEAEGGLEVPPARAVPSTVDA